MKTKSVGVNAILNVLRQGLTILFPLITYPYALRVLGTEGIGKVNFGQSMVSYFALIATLGTTSYIVREGSKRKGNKEQLQLVASEVYSINIIFTIGAYVLLVLALLFVPKLRDYRLLIFLQSLSIIFTTIGIDWINTIYEDFVRITIRSIITYIISFVLLFLFVRDESDYYIYALLTVITVAVICISNRFYFKRLINVRFTWKTNIKKHIRPLVTLFANSLAITINTNFDTTMLGWMKGDYYVGLYSLSVKVYSVIRNMICAIYNVAIPRLSYYLGNNKLREYKELNTKIWSCLILLVIPASVGMVCESRQIAQIMGGTAMQGSVFSLQCLAIALIFSTLSGALLNAMNISLSREKENLKVTIYSAVLNIGLNFIFIPLFAHNGAAMTTLISEIFVLIFAIKSFPSIEEYLDIKLVKKEMIHSILGSAVIVVSTSFVNRVMSNLIIQISLGIVFSGIGYVLILIFMKDKFVKEILAGVASKIAKFSRGE